MDLVKIEKLIDKYFEGTTSIAEEKEIKAYFSSSNVAQHLQQYQSVFGFYTHEKNTTFNKPFLVKAKNKFSVLYLSIAASVVIALGIVIFKFNNSDVPKSSGEYGTYDDPEIAMQETQKALALVSEKLNLGIESVSYINEYERSKNRVFKK
jgi:hypothetical protein